MMKHKFRKTGILSALLLVGAFTVGPVVADKPSWGGGGDRDGKGHADRDREHSGRDSGGAQVSGRGHFSDRHRTTVQRHFAEEFGRGHCPPGLAKKNNGCMPPGQARQWTYGQPLPRDVVSYDVSPALVVEFGLPPRGHRYVRVAGDILLLAIGTSIVVDAIQDLGRM
jgi:Ni/Co efflux regulator RcnB